MKKSAINSLVLFFILLSSTGNASEKPLFKLENPYIQLSVGYSAYLGNDSGVSDDAGVIKWNAGVDLNEYFGMEAGGLTLTTTITKTVDIYYLNLNTRHAFAKDISIIGKLGVTSWDTAYSPFIFQEPETDNGYGLMLGAELKYDFYKDFSATLSGEYYGSVEELPITVGLRYTF